MRRRILVFICVLTILVPSAVFAASKPIEYRDYSIQLSVPVMWQYNISEQDEYFSYDDESVEYEKIFALSKDSMSLNCIYVYKDTDEEAYYSMPTESELKTVFDSKGKSYIEDFLYEKHRENTQAKTFKWLEPKFVEDYRGEKWMKIPFKFGKDGTKCYLYFNVIADTVYRYMVLNFSPFNNDESTNKAIVDNVDSMIASYDDSYYDTSPCYAEIIDDEYYDEYGDEDSNAGLTICLAIISAVVGLASLLNKASEEDSSKDGSKDAGKLGDKLSGLASKTVSAVKTVSTATKDKLQVDETAANKSDERFEHSQNKPSFGKPKQKKAKLDESTLDSGNVIKKKLSSVKLKEDDAITDTLKVESARTYNSDYERNLKALYNSGILTWNEYEDMKSRYAKKYAESDARKNKGVDD